MLEHKLNRLFVDQHLFESDGNRVREVLPHTLQTKAIEGAADKQ